MQLLAKVANYLLYTIYRQTMVIANSFCKKNYKTITIFSLLSVLIEPKITVIHPVTKREQLITVIDNWHTKTLKNHKKYNLPQRNKYDQQ